MAMTTTHITDALATNASAGGTITQEQAATNIANAIINTIKSMTITYTTGLVSAAPGSAVTGSLASVVIS
jgi:hypothetical protein